MKDNKNNSEEKAKIITYNNKYLLICGNHVIKEFEKNMLSLAKYVAVQVNEKKITVLQLNKILELLNS